MSAILDGAFATRRFFVLLALATTIAAGGLLSNSAAVIIGAMIVAPLMGPILGLSLGMVTGRQRLEVGALVAEVLGVAMAVGIGYVAGLVPLNLGASAEMLARTAPNAFDLGIAFASGLAGAYVSVNRKVNSAIAGVAISVALVPPLATCGLLLALDQRRAAVGAFLLFAANFFSIQIAAALVFVLYGFIRTSQRHPRSTWPLFARFLPGIVALTLMAWSMTGTLVGLVQDHSLEAAIRKALDEEIARRSGGRLEDILRREQVGNELRVVASALTPQVFEPAQVKQIETSLDVSTHRRVRLILRSVVSQDVDDAGRVYISDEQRRQTQQARDGADYLARATAVLKAGLQQTKGAELDGVDRRGTAGEPLLVALVRGPEALDPDAVATLEDALRQELGGSVRLIVRNVATRDTDRDGYLYEAKPEEAPKPDPVLDRLRVRIRGVIRSRMARQPARTVDEVEVEANGDRIDVRAVVSATLPVRPGEVAAIESDLRRFVDPRIALNVRTVLQSQATAAGWSPAAQP